MSIAKTTETLYTGRMKPKYLKTQADIVAAYGGKPKMAAWFGITHQAVCNWFIQPEKGEPPGIPTGYQYRIHLWAAAHGYVLHPGAFGLTLDGKPIGRMSAKAA